MKGNQVPIEVLIYAFCRDPAPTHFFPMTNTLVSRALRPRPVTYTVPVNHPLSTSAFSGIYSSSIDVIESPIRSSLCLSTTNSSSSHKNRISEPKNPIQSNASSTSALPSLTHDPACHWHDWLHGPFPRSSKLLVVKVNTTFYIRYTCGPRRYQDKQWSFVRLP